MKSRSRKVCVVVTARASYSRIKSALVEISKHPKLELQLVVAASALLDRYGAAVEIMKADGFKIDASVFNAIEGGDLLGQAKTTGLGIIELSNIFDRLNPDMVVTIADRYETMATAIAASYLQLPLVHVQGGEISGNIDEKVRHAITKLADLHLVSTDQARERLIKMGEYPQQVFVTGCPSIDLAAEVCKHSDLEFNPYQKYGGVGARPPYKQGYLVVMQHPVTDEYQNARTNIEETLYAIRELNKPTFWFWPNIDAGADGTSRGIRGFREKYQLNHLHFFKNMEPLDFLRLIKNSKCLVGNSSVAIRECSYLGVPAVNIGPRQLGRARGSNIVDSRYDRREIVEAVIAQCSQGPIATSNLYGQGDAGKRMAEILAEQPLISTKQLTY